MNLHLETSALGAPGVHCVLTVDGAGWRRLLAATRERTHRYADRIRSIASRNYAETVSS